MGPTDGHSACSRIFIFYEDPRKCRSGEVIKVLLC